MKESYTLKHLFFFCFFLIFSGVLSAQYVSNVTYDYSCPCKVTVTYDIDPDLADLAVAGDVALYYSSDTTQGWTLATTFTGKTAGHHSDDFWDCHAAGVKYGLFYHKLEFVCPCRVRNAASVVINGVEWANRNVGTPGNFAANPTSAGRFYQWNIRVGWSNTDPRTSSPAGRAWISYLTYDYTSTSWTSANDPSPSGFRVPNAAQVNTLLDADAVTMKWVTLNGVNGYCYTDKLNNNSIFLPAAGWRNGIPGTGVEGELMGVGLSGNYWTRTQSSGGEASYWNDSRFLKSWYKTGGYSVRPVK